MAMMNRVLHSRFLFLPKAPLVSPFLSHGRLTLYDEYKIRSHRILDLTSKKCVPCDSKDVRPMSEQSANELLAQVQGWNLLSEDGVMKLHRSWKVKSFTKGLELFQLVADVAEAEGHHPDLHLVGWNNVKIDIWTHSVGGLTENDFILAAKINSLHVEHLLRRKAAA
ncbi:pterin-4-alpha-carbinolamine dehydratase 2, mitochondrial isoform X2 [Elaeis guineensis]|uniref:pterin-4-alpha-carbinolamine dehydratase 2, mitochondrial isoform X2 n=1 Tax=Elaeis guineensis var. tenera TaxID=51953 RepID=UPI003C6CF5BA